MQTEITEQTPQVTETHLRRLLRYWQRRLRLADWKCSIRFAPKTELKDCQGKNEHNENARTSEILVLNPADYDPNEYPGKIPQDVEDTVVHELLHLHFSWFKPRNKAEEIMLEQAIESIAGALIALKRRKKSITGVS
jgi:hypothetical protein